MSFVSTITTIPINDLYPLNCHIVYKNRHQQTQHQQLFETLTFLLLLKTSNFSHQIKCACIHPIYKNILLSYL